jgi:hypothetical protein
LQPSSRGAEREHASVVGCIGEDIVVSGHGVVWQRSKVVNIVITVVVVGGGGVSLDGNNRGRQYLSLFFYHTQRLLLLWWHMCMYVYVYMCMYVYMYVDATELFIVEWELLMMLMNNDVVACA